MERRFVSIWFRHLNTDWFSLREPQLKSQPFVLRTPSHGRMVITSTNAVAESKGISKGMVLADARAIILSLQVLDDKEDLPEKLLNRLAIWCIRFTPIAAVDLPDGLLLEVTGCTHLWGSEHDYLVSIARKLILRGYDVSAALASTPSVAWAVARFGSGQRVIERGKELDALLTLPPEALQLERETNERLHKLGLHKISQFIFMPRSSLRRRFGEHILQRIDLALGKIPELLQPVIPPEPFQERLPCIEPVATRPGIEMALQELLEKLCLRLQQEQKGIRTAVFRGYRVDGKVEQIDIGTSRPSHAVNHLFRLFALKVQNIEPALGIELFTLEATTVDDHVPQQERMWEEVNQLEDVRLAELIDNLSGKIGSASIKRYLPAEHYWPERSIQPALSLEQKPETSWRPDLIRPITLLGVPEKIDVTAPIPDYPPMLFRHKGKLHKIIKADGPERIEQEWWLQQGQHRDYYRLEDEEGNRFWVFRLGHYDEKTFQWFIHGYFP
jgi:protein ImuB